MNKQEFIEKLTEERANVLKAIEGVSDVELVQPMAEGKWSIKDTLGHLTAWEAAVINAFEQKARGERPTMPNLENLDAWNAEQAAKREGKSADEVRHEFNESRKRLLTIVSGLADDEGLWSPERSTAKMLSGLIHHDRHHWKALCEYRRLDCAES